MLKLADLTGLRPSSARGAKGERRPHVNNVESGKDNPPRLRSWKESKKQIPFHRRVMKRRARRRFAAEPRRRSS